MALVGFDLQDLVRTRLSSVVTLRTLVESNEAQSCGEVDERRLGELLLCIVGAGTKLMIACRM